MNTRHILLLPGDGIGPEVMAQGEKILLALKEKENLKIIIQSALIGGCAIDAQGVALPSETLQAAKQADAVLLGAVGGPQWDSSDATVRPEQGLLGIRSALNLFANLRPALLFPALQDASTLKPQVVAGLDMMIVRELTGGVYFGKPQGESLTDSGERQAFNTMIYSESEITRIAHCAFSIAKQRNNRLCSVDKANVLAVSRLWRQVLNEVAHTYPQVELSHLYVDNAAMQLVRAPKQFDVIVTSNLFGDILSDCAAMLTGSIGMLPSASLDHKDKGMYEPVHGSAPDIAGRGIANPLAMILSVAMMLRYTFKEVSLALKIEQAVNQVLTDKLRTADIATHDTQCISTDAMGDAVLAAMY